MATNTAEDTTHVFEIYLKISLNRLRIVCTAQTLFGVLISIRRGIILCGNKMATKIASKTIKVDIK